MMRSLAAFRHFPAFFHLLTALFVAAVLTGCSSFGDTPDETVGWSAGKLYSEAKDAQADGAWDKAAKYLEKLESRYPYGRFAQQAQLELGYIYWKSNEPGSALAACDRFIKLHPNHPAVDYVYYLKGLINFNEDLGLLGYISSQDPTERDPKAAREAFDSFRELVTRFPNSKYAPDAVKRMEYLVNALASMEVHVGRYYIMRGAYIAAANRAQFAVKTYPQAPAIEEAMFILVTAYDKMGMTDLRDDAERVMRQNFPKSRFYKDGLERKTAWWKLW
ncbi:outer membrane protein assembly factor BamD [Dechloromonas denitrificans]|jgi:outer membrane protein assembly factor BamD|uniref:outer membrane protein assembly factor BamD n=1 Tax=Azonexaceae TaxID=2008795 RepID=UPI001CF895F8|nr:outer membrane protein assembly factor BamD [Dechloromonas denitrificans]